MALGGYDMRLNARLDPQHEEQLLEIQKLTHDSVSEVIRRALEVYHHTICERPEVAKDVLYASGFVGCATVESDLSTNYKAELNKSWDSKR